MNSIIYVVAHNTGKHQWNASSIEMFIDVNGRWYPIVQSHWSKHYFVLGLIVSSRQKVLMLRRGCPSGAVVRTLQSVNEITVGIWNLFRASTDAMRKFCCYVTRSTRHPQSGPTFQCLCLTSLNVTNRDFDFRNSVDGVIISFDIGYSTHYINQSWLVVNSTIWNIIHWNFISK